LPKYRFLRGLSIPALRICRSRKGSPRSIERNCENLWARRPRLWRRAARHWRRGSYGFAVSRFTRARGDAPLGRGCRGSCKSSQALDTHPGGRRKSLRHREAFAGCERHMRLQALRRKNLSTGQTRRAGLEGDERHETVGGVEFTVPVWISGELSFKVGTLGFERRRPWPVGRKLCASATAARRR
jgi:hypothetical protein